MPFITLITLCLYSPTLLILYPKVSMVFPETVVSPLVCPPPLNLNATHVELQQASPGQLLDLVSRLQQLQYETPTPSPEPTAETILTRRRILTQLMFGSRSGAPLYFPQPRVDRRKGYVICPPIRQRLLAPFWRTVVAEHPVISASPSWSTSMY